MSQYDCAHPRRREEVRRVDFLNGIDFVEVAPGDQRTLHVHFLHPVSGLGRENFRVVGGVRVTDVQVRAVVGVAGEVVTLETDRSGDYSTYTLRLATSAAVEEPPAGFDPMLAAVPFSFKVDCPSEFDCAPREDCREPAEPAPYVDYLAKDYGSFRRLMFDRLAVTMPEWRERNPADVGVALVELLAYTGDRLSYHQDAVATEAYLGSARRRTSVRRHARLVDYAMHDGVNARVWLAFETDTDRGTTVAPAVPRRSRVLAPASGTEPALVFETLHDLAELRVSRNEIRLYTWSDAGCCLSKGATGATLEGSAALLGLHRGDVLILEEVLGADSGQPADADVTHRHVVRLAEEPRERTDPLTLASVLEVRWHDDDALPFALCLKAFPGGGRAAVARGNVALADHGETFASGGGGDGLIPAEAGGRAYRPRLVRTGLAQAVAYEDHDARGRSAAAVTGVDGGSALPAVVLRAGGETWRPRRDLLGSDRFAPEFVVETEIGPDGRARAHVRFGDGVHGRRPAEGTRFACEYRLGGGAVGNVGADALTRLEPAIEGVTVRNPLSARGGADPEPARQTKMYAPQAFRTQERAVTEADYAAAAERHPGVQRAMCTRRWTGMFHTMFVTIDRRGGAPVTPEFERDLRGFLERFRLAGYDLEIDGPRYVALDIALNVCVLPGHSRSEVKRALLEAFGTRGFFHPDNHTFGQAVYLSQIVAHAMRVRGVRTVDVPVDGFKRFGKEPRGERDAGLIPIHRLEIARADNDPSRPENGRIDFVMRGGL